MTTKDLYRKGFTTHKWNAKTRGIEFLFTFEQWRDWWIATGKWELRGRGRGMYCMRRHGDVGPYSIDNVFCGTNEENVRDGNLGKAVSQETREKIAEALKGVPHEWSRGEKNPMHRPEVKAKMSAAIGGSKNYAAKMVGTPHGIWGSATECARALSIPVPTVNWRCKHNKLGFAYLT